MPITITKTAVSFDGFRVLRELQDDGVTWKYFIDISYRVTSNEEPYIRNRLVELTGAQETQAATMFASITTRIKNVEGLP